MQAREWTTFRVISVRGDRWRGRSQESRGLRAPLPLDVLEALRHVGLGLNRVLLDEHRTCGIPAPTDSGLGNECGTCLCECGGGGARTRL